MGPARETIRSQPVCASIYDALVNLLQEIGPFDVEVKKTSLHITHGRAFLGIHPRSMSLLLNIVTTAPLEDGRIRRTERVSANRVHNEVVVSSEAEVDDQLRSWLEQAYLLTHS